MIKHLDNAKFAILWISLTTNVFLSVLLYSFVTGQIEKAPTNYVDLIGVKK